MKKRPIISIMFATLLILLISLTGCSNTETDERKVDTSLEPGESNITPLEITNVTPMTDGEAYYGVYFQFENTTEEAIDISEISASFYDKDDVELSTEDTQFAPAHLEPGEIGYGGVIVYNESSFYSLENVTATITPTFDYSTKEVTLPLSCTNARIEESSVTDRKTVEVTVINTSPDQAYEPSIVCGLFDSDGNLIGYASNLTATLIDPNSEVNEICDNILVYPDNDLSNVTSIEARVKE